MDGRFGRLLMLGDLLTALAAVLSGNPSVRAWAWVFHLDAPLDLGFWMPAWLVVRHLVFRGQHPPV